MQLLKTDSSAKPPKKKRAYGNTAKLERRRRSTMRQWFGYTLLAIAALNTLAVTALIFFSGFGLVVLSTTVLLTLIGETITYDAAMFCMVAKRLFAD
jgi:hypothetical protein